MGFLSQAGHLIVRSQTTPGVYEPDTGTAGMGVKTRGGTLAPSRELLVPDPEIGGGRDVADAYLGTVAFSGDIDFYARFESLGMFLKGVLGDAAVATATGVSTHTFVPTDGVLPLFSAEQRIANGFEVFQFSDIKMNTLHLEAEANGYLMGTVGMIAKNAISGATPSDPTTLYDNTPMAVGTNITVTYNGVTLPAQSFSLDITNNLEDDNFRLGSFFLNDVTEKRREMTMGFTIRPQDSAYWRQAVYGTPASTSVGGLTTKQATVINISTYEDIPGSTPPTKYSLVITVPKSIIAPFEVSPSGDDVIEHDLEIRAVRPDPAVDLTTFVLRNGLAALA